LEPGIDSGGIHVRPELDGIHGPSRSSCAERIPTGAQKRTRVRAGFLPSWGILLAGSDPTGMGGTLAGFGDQRELELLVEAGLTRVHVFGSSANRNYGKKPSGAAHRDLHSNDPFRAFTVRCAELLTLSY